MKIGGWQKVSLIDFPNQVALIIFVTGCNFRCPFCFNRDLVLGNLPLVSPKSVISFLKKRKKVLDGVVISGGEPTLQWDLEDFIRQIRKLGFKIKLDTNGGEPEILQKLIKKHLLDYVALDFKVPFEDYPKIVGTNIENLESKISQSIKILIGSGTDFEFRTTVVPKIHDKKVLVKMANEIKEIIVNCKLKIENCQWFWQNFQPKNCLEPKFNKLKPYESEKLIGFINEVKKIIPSVKLRD